MILPEFPLLLRGNRGESGSCRKAVAAEWKMFENYLYMIWIFVEHLLKQRPQFGAKGSLEIAEGDNNHVPVFIAKKGGIFDVNTLLKIYEYFLHFF